MLTKKLIECCDCHEIFESFCSNKKRCDRCQKKHHAEDMRKIYARRKALLMATPKEQREKDLAGRKIAQSVTFLNLPCPWSAGRLPMEVRLNQVWG